MKLGQMDPKCWSDLWLPLRHLNCKQINMEFRMHTESATEGVEFITPIRHDLGADWRGWVGRRARSCVIHQIKCLGLLHDWMAWRYKKWSGPNPLPVFFGWLVRVLRLLGSLSPEIELTDLPCVIMWAESASWCNCRWIFALPWRFNDFQFANKLLDRFN